MAFLEHAIELGDLPESSNDYELLPAGWYTCTISTAELANTKSGTGQKIALRYTVTGPTHQGRVVFGNINIRNQSTKAEEIGRQQLGELMRAINIPRLTDTDQLIGASLSIKVAVREARVDPATGQRYEAQNEVKGFKADGAGSAAPKPSTVPSFSKSAEAAKSAGSEPPWAKK